MSRWMALAAGLALAATLVGCGADAGPATEPAPDQPAAEQPATEQPSTEGEAKVAPVEIGTAVTSGDWTLTAKEAEREDKAGGASAEGGQELLVIEFELTNDSSFEQGIGPTSFKLRGADGTELQATPTSDAEFIFNTPQPIKAGEKRTIKIAYSVPAGAKAFQWTFEPFVAGGTPEPAVINIP